MAFEQHARASEDDDGKRVGGRCGVAQRGADRLRVVGVHRAHVFDAERRDHALHVELARRAVLERLAVEGVALAARHGGRAVVEDADGAGALVVHGRDQRRQARVRERGVADDGDDGTVLGARKRELETVSHRHRGAHVDAGVHRRERRQRAERVAPDVAGDDGAQARELLEHESVRTARTERGRAGGNVGLGLRMGGLSAAERGADKPA